MDRQLFPEAFYGLWGDDLSQDGVLLLINPGAGPAHDDQARNWNESIRRRFATWGEIEYLAYDAEAQRRVEDRACAGGSSVSSRQSGLSVSLLVSCTSSNPVPTTQDAGPYSRGKPADR